MQALLLSGLKAADVNVDDHLLRASDGSAVDASWWAVLPGSTTRLVLDVADPRCGQAHALLLLSGECCRVKASTLTLAGEQM